ncbi:MAG: hypothetical protein GPJ52_04215 [Candidatus Heimdallarchaeota archaeon]|nr:hypothetical protein [Candidatus Heimdallarchaeota archaeon]
MTRKKAVLCLGLLTLTFFISLFTVTNSKVEAKSYQTTLSYGEHYQISSIRNMDNSSSIEWSFTGTSNSTGIEVWIFDENNYTLFQTSNITTSGFQQSDGTHYDDSGTWSVGYTDKWSVVFWHNQPLGDSTELTIEVNFDRGGLIESELWYVLGILGIFIVIVSIFLINHLLQAKKKSSLDQTAHGTPSSFDRDSKTRMMTKLDKRESRIRRERILEGGSLPTLSELVIYSPSNNEKITTAEIDVRGKTAIKSIVWINNQASFVDVDGSFIGSVKLFKGKNPIDIVAIGPYGNILASSMQINCASKDAPSSQSASSPYLLPDQAFDIRHDVASGAFQRTADVHPSAIPTEKLVKRKRGKDDSVFTEVVPTQTQESIIVPESEIDPSVLAALKGEPLSEETISVQSVVSLDEIEPDTSAEISESEIPPIPEIPKDIIEEEVSATPTIIEEDEEAIKVSVDLLEEIVDSEGKFEPDEMVPKQPGEKVSEEKDELETIELDEFKPLQQQEEGTQELEIETKTQKLDDERSTVILQHNGILKSEDGKITQVIKIEKRIECIEGKWYSTLGIVNTSDFEIKKLELIEFISNTMEISDELPTNVEDPVVDTLPEGVKITWIANDVKSQMKIFITYTEQVNPLDIIDEEQSKPKVIIRK